MKRQQQRRNAFTLLDVAVASVLTAVLATMLSSTWGMFSKPTSSLIAWGQLFQEMDIAVATLARDLGGSLPENPNGSNKRQGLLVGCKTTNDLTYGDHLLLCFDGGNAPDGLASWNSDTDDTIIDYYVDSSKRVLYRQNMKTGNGNAVVVASNVESSITGVNGLVITDITPSDPNGNLRIELTFTFHFPGESGSHYWMQPLSRKCILIVKKMP
jgi:type II secretory pathway component PulJ